MLIYLLGFFKNVRQNALYRAKIINNSFTWSAKVVVQGSASNFRLENWFD